MFLVFIQSPAFSQWEGGTTLCEESESDRINYTDIGTAGQVTVINGQTYTSQNLHVLGDLEISNGNVTFDDCFIKFDEGVEIVVEDGNALSIENGSELFACDDLWKGITAEGFSVVDIDDSRIEDAEMVIEAQNNSFIFVEDSELNRNLTGIYAPDGWFFSWYI